MAEHGEAAWAMLQQKPYQLLISDCIMPVLDGFELARRIRRAEAREGGHLRIIALTANVVEGEEEKCRSAGMDDYAGKPLTLDRLARLLHNQFHGDEAALASLGDQRDGLATGSDPIDWAALSAILGSEDPSDLREVANFFAVSFGGLLDELDKAMAAGDSDLVVRAAHSAKGAARNGAAPILATLMNKIEMAARDGGITILQPIVAAARDEFSRLEEWLRAG